MELDEFVSATLEQILRGIEKAQDIDGGEQVNARGVIKEPGGSLLNAGAYGMYTRVDFDVAVSGQSAGKGGANLKVFGVGMEAGGEHKTEIANRVKFSVPLRLPDGDITKSAEIEQTRAVAREEQKKKILSSKMRRSGRDGWMGS